MARIVVGAEDLTPVGVTVADPDDRADPEDCAVCDGDLFAEPWFGLERS